MDGDKNNATDFMFYPRLEEIFILEGCFELQRIFLIFLVVKRLEFWPSAAHVLSEKRIKTHLSSVQ